MKWVTAKKLSELTGLTLTAIDGRRSSGEWRMGSHWKTMPDRRVWYNYELIAGDGATADIPDFDIETGLVHMSKMCGVYCLLHDMEIVYIGRSNNVDRRVWEHDANGLVFDSYSYIPAPEHESVAIERALIRKYRPKLNTVWAIK